MFDQTTFFFLFVFLLFIHSEYTLTHSLISFVTILVLFFVFYGPLLSMVQISYDEDISDAEKVYQECQQSGPLSFSDCIPPARMKHCNKIGEGTFGEVFSTINESNETVALKVCAQFNHMVLL